MLAIIESSPQLGRKTDLCGVRQLVVAVPDCGSSIETTCCRSSAGRTHLFESPAWSAKAREQVHSMLSSQSLNSGNKLPALHRGLVRHKALQVITLELGAAVEEGELDEEDEASDLTAELLH